MPPATRTAAQVGIVGAGAAETAIGDRRTVVGKEDVLPPASSTSMIDWIRTPMMLSPKSMSILVTAPANAVNRYNSTSPAVPSASTVVCAMNAESPTSAFSS